MRGEVHHLDVRREDLEGHDGRHPQEPVDPAARDRALGEQEHGRRPRHREHAPVLSRVEVAHQVAGEHVGHSGHRCRSGPEAELARQRVREHPRKQEVEHERPADRAMEIDHEVEERGRVVHRVGQDREVREPAVHVGVPLRQPAPREDLLDGERAALIGLREHVGAEQHRVAVEDERREERDRGDGHGAEDRPADAPLGLRRRLVARRPRRLPGLSAP